VSGELKETAELLARVRARRLRGSDSSTSNEVAKPEVPDWTKPSEKLRALADAPEPMIKPMTTAEKLAAMGSSTSAEEFPLRAGNAWGRHTKLGEQGEPLR
jgi:hypothetical protein